MIPTVVSTVTSAQSDQQTRDRRLPDGQQPRMPDQSSAPWTGRRGSSGAVDGRIDGHGSRASAGERPSCDGLRRRRRSPALGRRSAAPRAWRAPPGWPAMSSAVGGIVARLLGRELVDVVEVVLEELRRPRAAAAAEFFTKMNSGRDSGVYDLSAIVSGLGRTGLASGPFWTATARSSSLLAA